MVLVMKETVKTIVEATIKNEPELKALHSLKVKKRFPNASKKKCKSSKVKTK